MESKVIPRARMVPIPAKPVAKIEKCFRPTIEITGNGNLLCYEAFFGRFFRSSENCIREAVDKFMQLYAEGCPINYNDLYSLFNIATTHAGAEYGYSPNEDYRVDLQFDIVRVPADENFEGMEEEVLTIEPAGSWCYPYECYMEV